MKYLKLLTPVYPYLPVFQPNNIQLLLPCVCICYISCEQNWQFSVIIGLSAMSFWKNYNIVASWTPPTEWPESSLEQMLVKGLPLVILVYVKNSLHSNEDIWNKRKYSTRGFEFITPTQEGATKIYSPWQLF